MTGKGPSGPGPRHTARYRPGQVPTHADGRLESPAAARNIGPIRDAVRAFLSDRSGPVLEVGSGTGEHRAALAAAMPGLTWIASDPHPDHRRSADAWARHTGIDQPPALTLDALSADWAAPLSAAGHPPPLTAIFCSNVLHIAPPAVAKAIFSQAGALLSPGGMLLVYGPFTEAGRFDGDGNRAFDAGLRADNPDWGLRDIDWLDELARDAGLSPAERHVMPARNRLLRFTRP
ncbi:DUF938 domain-containing protein [Oceanomicrobium pacificus]|uniref:DUF938 domain-containing protein n=1 Tax=Oceanomicrobium pacificus TaxID=2692916 RepID=A0A6B0TS53_9RHOB|nr:DUF938 domain-containing protein [Oceanomicrobium pacificus]MXU65559.1 DUF938 domain-containing protein [Oceanomicrobium pacificus]